MANATNSTLVGLTIYFYAKWQIKAKIVNELPDYLELKILEVPDDNEYYKVGDNVLYPKHTGGALKIAD